MGNPVPPGGASKGKFHPLTGNPGHAEIVVAVFARDPDMLYRRGSFLRFLLLLAASSLPFWAVKRRFLRAQNSIDTRVLQTPFSPTIPSFDNSSCEAMIPAFGRFGRLAVFR